MSPRLGILILALILTALSFQWPTLDKVALVLVIAVMILYDVK